MPEGPDGPAWVAVPLQASVTEIRGRKPRDVNVIRTVPVAMPRPTPAEAPVCARVPLSVPINGDEWAYLRHARGLAWVRHDGGSYWRPLTGPRGFGTQRLDGLAAALAEGRDWTNDWDDWPFALAARRWSNGRVPLRDPSFPAKCWHTDVDAAASAEGLRLGGVLACIDGVLHARCAEPVNEVHAVGYAKGRPSVVAVVPRAGPARTPGHGESPDCIQVFRADASEEAAAYAAEMAVALGCKASASRAWQVEGVPPFARDDAAEGHREAAARLVSRSAPLVGAMPRKVVEAWLDMRDASGEPHAFGEALDRLLSALVERRPGGRMAMLCWFEAHRLIPGAYGREAEVDASDAEALSGL